MNILFTGGLGNQMFEYALVLALRQRGYSPKIDISYYDFFKMHNGYELNRVFGIEENTINKQGLHMLWLRTLHKFRPKSLYQVDSYQYNEEVFCTPKPYIFGYWQNENYFLNIENEVRKLFKFREIDEKNRTIAEKMHNCCSVSLHIRRGDYAKFGMTLIGKEYYRKAIEYVKYKVESPFFYVFSDDAQEANGIVKNMGINYDLISHNHGSESFKDMYLMSQCKHNIIANSSFSWWGAWLNYRNDKVVVAPKHWDVNKLFFKPQCSNWILV
jgi:hypothetical protein